MPLHISAKNNGLGHSVQPSFEVAVGKKEAINIGRIGAGHMARGGVKSADPRQVN